MFEKEIVPCRRSKVTEKSLSGYVGKDLLIELESLPDYVIEKCDFMTGVELMQGDTLKLSFRNGRVGVEAVTSGVPFWGSQDRVEDETIIEELSDYKDAIEKVIGLGYSNLIINISDKSASYYGSVYGSGDTLIVGREYHPSESVLIDAWRNYFFVLDIVGQSRVPYDLLVYMVRYVTGICRDVFGKDIDFDVRKIRVSMTVESGSVRSEYSLLPDGENESYAVVRTSSFQDAALRPIKMVSEICKKNIVFSINIGGCMWNRGNCILSSFVVANDRGVLVNIEG